MTIVQTRLGPIAGRLDRGVHRFDGVRFAGDAGGAGRWLPASVPKAWADPIWATSHGPSAPQTPPPYDWLGDVPELKDEDCLFLNIASPALGGAARPVLVWIHGGAFVYGSGAEPVYDGVALAAKGELVIVTVNYRLGAFGFFGGDHIDPRLPAAANLGIRDQIAALRWVRDNIAAFGGDPGNVTVAGESAGGMSVATLLATREADGLYHRAIIQSGGDYTIGSTEQSATIARRIVELAGTDDPAELRRIPADAFVKIQTDVMISVFANFDAVDTPWSSIRAPFQPTAEAGFLDIDAVQAIAAGAAPRVPILVGACSDEWNLFAFRDAAGIDEPLLRRRLARMFADAEAAAAVYTRERPSASPADVFAGAMSDYLWRQPALRLAQTASDAGYAAFSYLVEWGEKGCWHGFDLPLLFGNLPVSSPLTDRFCGVPPAALTEAIQQSWIAFAAHGDPSNQLLGEWPSYDRNRRSVALFNEAPLVASDPYAARRRLWSAWYEELRD